MKVVCYARVSRDDLTCENQKKILDEFCKSKGITDYEYVSEEMSSRKTRPRKELIIQRFRKRELDTIVVVRIDRWARSNQELIYNVEEIVNGGGRFISIQNGFDFCKKDYNSTQQLMLSIFGSFAQFERELIRERTLEGLARAKAQGKKLGRPKGAKNLVNRNPPINTPPYPILESA